MLAKDNESGIKLLKNGRDSCTWNSKHIAIKYFWVTDRIKDGQIVAKSFIWNHFFKMANNTAAATAEDNLLAVETLVQLQALPSVKIPTIVVCSKFIKKIQAFKRARDEDIYVHDYD